MSGPTIPERYSSLLSISRQNDLNDIKKRKVSASSMLLTASSAAKFVDSKIEDIDLGIKYVDEMRMGLREAFEDGNLSASQYEEAIKDMEEYSRPKEREMVIWKRQKKLIKDDLDEYMPSHDKLEDAYASILMNKVMAATANQKKKKHNQSAFKKAVLAFYGAERNAENADESDYLWCHLTGWQLKISVKAAHIVPKLLESSELSYLFGAGEARLNEANNGLTLLSVIEGGLDSGMIVLVPLPYVKGEGYQDIDGKELEFLTANRPARRYLYFRYIITYLHHKQEGTLEWVGDVEAEGRMWATPGPYLRRSMLMSLAKKVSDDFLPEVVYKQTTFEEVEPDESVARPQEDSGMVLALAYRLKEEKEAVVDEMMGSDDSETDEDEDEDEE